MSDNNEQIKSEIEASLIEENALIEDISISSNGKSIKKTSLKDRIWALQQIEKRASKANGVLRAKVRFTE